MRTISRAPFARAPLASVVETTKTECAYEPVTRTVMRYELQLESTYVPPHMEMLTRPAVARARSSLHEIEAAAGDPSLAPPARTRGPRIEGRIFTKH